MGSYVYGASADFCKAVYDSYRAGSFCGTSYSPHLCAFVSPFAVQRLFNVSFSGDNEAGRVNGGVCLQGNTDKRRIYPGASRRIRRRLRMVGDADNRNACCGICDIQLGKRKQERENPDVIGTFSCCFFMRL